MSLTGLLSQHLPVLTVLLPAFTAMLLVLIGDSRERLLLARRIALVSVTLGLLLALKLALDANGGELRVYRVGDWPAPFGIVLVIDRLAALMLVLTQAIALARAGAVRDHIKRVSPAQPNDIRIDARGLCCYIANNDTPEGRARNRRVEVVFTASSEGGP